VDLTKIPAPPALGIRVFPNPVTETAVLTFEGLEASEHQFRLMDVSGKIMREMTFNGNNFSLRCEGLAGGVYFFQITDNAGKIAGAGKVLLR